MQLIPCLQAMWETSLLQKDPVGADRVLKMQVLFLVLSPFDNEQSDAMHILDQEKGCISSAEALIDEPVLKQNAHPCTATKRPSLRAALLRLAKLPLFKQLLKLFITKELFHFSDLKPSLQAELVAMGEFSEKELTLVLDTLHNRVSQHNILVRPRLKRTSHIGHLPPIFFDRMRHV